MAHLQYVPLESCRQFHADASPIRCLVGPVGSGKTSAAVLEVCYYAPRYCRQEFGIEETRWVVLRNTYVELMDTTRKTFLQWFPQGQWMADEKRYILRFPATDDCGAFTVDLMFRSCDRPEDVKKFKSLEITGYLVDESVEVHESIKRMLKNRIGRFPQKSPVRFGVEITNPPSIEDDIYSNYQWATGYGPPGPHPKRRPLKGHKGWWQRPRENEANLRPGYYDDLKEDYAYVQDWVDMYVNGKPGLALKGRPVYTNFSKDRHCSMKPLDWVTEIDIMGQTVGVPLIFGWDNSGNTPAAVVFQVIQSLQIQVLREYWTEREGIVDFTRRVLADMQEMYPGFRSTHYCDPAGFASYSSEKGGLTSNAELQRQEFGLMMIPGEQNWIVRQQSVEQMLARDKGMLIDPSCTRLTDGFIAGYFYAEVTGRPGEYHGQPIKNKYSHIHDALQYAVSMVFPARVRRNADNPYGDLVRDFGLAQRRNRIQEDDDAGSDFDPRRF